MQGKSSVDFSIFPQRELIKALSTINKEKFPANFAACEQEIQDRKKSGRWQELKNGEIESSGAILAYMSSWDRYRGHWAFFWVVLFLWLPFATLSLLFDGATIFFSLVWGSGACLLLYSFYRHAEFKCPRCRKKFFSTGLLSSANFNIKSCRHCGLAKFSVSEEG